MPSPRYETTGLPPEAAAGLSAFLPHFNRLAGSGAQQYKEAVRGYPGTRAIPIQFMDSTAPSPDPGDLALAGTARSSDAPDAIWPNIYWSGPTGRYRPGAGMPVQVYDPTAPELTTMIPVPAVSLRTTYLKRSARLSAAIDTERQKAMPNPAGRLMRRWSRRFRGNELPDG